MSDSSDRASSDLTRREALCALAGLPLVLGLGTGSLTSRAWDFVAHHRSPGQPPYSPHFFNAAEWRTVQALVDDIIPRDERSGSATDAGVPEFMDFIMTDQPYAQKEMREGLAWINDESHRRFDKPFAACSNHQRAAILDDIAWPERTPAAMRRGAAFFTSFRDLTASGFWSSRLGVADLQYIGNVVVHDWQGCPAPALAKLGVTY